MNRKEKAKIISSVLNRVYKKVPVPLNHNSPYTLLVAVLLSAQCTDERVNKVTPYLFKKAKTPKQMIKLSYEEVYSIIKPCGLGPKKSRAILNLSSILVNEFNSIVPNDILLLEKLPGVGHKTASVVVSQAFDIPSFPVDTHIHRLAQRWGLTNGKNVRQTEIDLKKVFNIKSWNKLHLQIIFWGREFCTARSCWGLECEICRSCNPKRKRKFFHKKP
ncbi:MAG: endonuclease III [Rhizobiales bacterium TMED168]|nr:MAG: endonuclease III [Rhizobiales bacterium TMED168]|tara:strand:+ start:32642 stop:33295 length:654 start_codon:yes stop_codon:yes gene_type:complete